MKQASACESHGLARKHGFTLLEILTVVAIIMIIVAILFPAISAVRKAGRITKAQSDVAIVVHAFKNYYNEYSRWPTNLMGNDTGINIEGTAGGIEVGENVVRMFSGENLNRQNPRQIVFMEVPAGAVGAGGSFVDPWGSPYRYMCDFNYNGTVEITFTGGAATNLTDATITVAVWSRGQDKSDESGRQRDDVTSWKSPPKVSDLN